MRVSLEWLKEYVDLSGLSPEVIAEALTNSGLEVENIEYIGPKFDGVVVGKVEAVEPHPNADRLRLVTVNAGHAQNKVVCGAPNVREGILIAYAQEGATVISRKEGTLFRLEKATIRGVESSGMVCSLDELGLEDHFEKKEDGIWPLDGIVTEAQLGEDLKTALSLQSDVVLHVVPTANRGDLMCMVGIAREVSALFDRPLHQPQWNHPISVPARTDLQINLKDPEVCRYYAGVMMRNIKVGPAPAWMARRLQAAGVRSINNVVDITNYVMLEMGQPLHAFDQVKLNTSGTISVRRAQPGETLTTLDNMERKLTEESVVITMNDRPVALAGVMGGASTEIDEHSNQLFLESAVFPAPIIRRSAKSVGLRTEASARYERGVDLEQSKNAALRAADLLSQYAGAEFIRLVESPMPVTEAPKITLEFARIQKVLGLSLEPDVVVKIFKRLGFLLQATKVTTSLVVSVPSFRQADIQREIDLIEEVIRIHGYDKVPYTLPQNTVSVGSSPRERLVKTIDSALRNQGLQEVVTTSLIGPSLLEKTGFSVNTEQLVSVLNSHSSDHTMMRQSLLPNLIEVARFNQAQGIEDVWIYELGRTYFKLGKPNVKNAGVSERLYVAGLLTGTVLSGEWREKESADFFISKGILENLFAQLRLPNAVLFEPTQDAPYLHPGKAAALKLNGKLFGVLGEMHPQLQQRLKLRQPVYLFELNAEVLYKTYKQTSAQKTVSVISPYPAIKRDMAFLAPVSLSHQQILEVLKGCNEPVLRDVELFDEYRAEHLGVGTRSLAYRLTFQSDEGTLTDADVDGRLNQLKATLSEKLPVEFR
jgi:phenylalanyl-tRNA synthetase beta chain